MENWEEEFLNDRPVYCSKCKGKLFFQGSGAYKCEDCGNEDYDDFGKIKNYLDKNGISTTYDVHMNTGVSIDVINVLLRNGRLEIPDGSGVYIKCLNCGCSIRYGKYCPACASKLIKNLNGIFSVMGEKPQKSGDADSSMRYLGKNKKGK